MQEAIPGMSQKDIHASEDQGESGKNKTCPYHIASTIRNQL